MYLITEMESGILELRSLAIYNPFFFFLSIYTELNWLITKKIILMCNIYPCPKLNLVLYIRNNLEEARTQIDAIAWYINDQIKAD